MQLLLSLLQVPHAACGAADTAQHGRRPTVPQASIVDLRTDGHQLHQLSSWQLAQFKRVTGLCWRSLGLADNLLAVAAVTAMLAVSGAQLWLRRSVACLQPEHDADDLHGTDSAGACCSQLQPAWAWGLFVLAWRRASAAWTTEHSMLPVRPLRVICGLPEGPVMQGVGCLLTWHAETCRVCALGQVRRGGARLVPGWRPMRCGPCFEALRGDDRHEKICVRTSFDSN